MSEDTADESAHTVLEHIFQSVDDESADLSGKCQLVKRRGLRVIALTVSYIALDIPINTPPSSSHPEVNDGDHFSDDLSIDGETIACDPDDLSSSVSTLNSVNDQMERMTSQFLTPSGTSTYNFYKRFLDVA